MDNPNMELWNKVCKTDPKITKQVRSRGGFTAICAQHQVKNATAVFGPFGQGWGVKHERFGMVGDLLVYQAEMWYEQDGSYQFPIQSSAKNIDEDTAKKLATDALTKGLSKLGFNSDVFEGKFDDNKYVQQMTREFKEADLSDDEKKQEFMKKCKELIEQKGLTEEQQEAFRGLIGVEYLRDVPVKDLREVYTKLKNYKPE